MSAFSPLARGYASLTGEVDLYQEGIHILRDGTSKIRSRPSSCFPAIETDEVHRHGITVSPRSQSAMSGRGSLSHHGKIDGEMVLPKTYLSRKGALLLFSAPEGADIQFTEQQKLQLSNNLSALKSKDLKSKFGNLQKFVASVLSFGDLNYDVDTASVSDPNKKTVLQFLHELSGDEMVDWKTQPGGDLNFYLRDFKAQTKSTRFAFGDPYDLDEESKSKVRASSSSTGGRDLISAGNEQLLLDQFVRPTSQSSRRGSSQGSQRSYQVLSAGKLAASLKSEKFSMPHTTITDEEQEIFHNQVGQQHRITTCTPTTDSGGQRSRPASWKSRSSGKLHGASSPVTEQNGSVPVEAEQDQDYLGLGTDGFLHGVLHDSTKTDLPVGSLLLNQPVVWSEEKQEHGNVVHVHGLDMGDKNWSVTNKSDLTVAGEDGKFVREIEKESSLTITPSLDKSDTWTTATWQGMEHGMTQPLDDAELALLDEAATLPHPHRSSLSSPNGDNAQSEDSVSVDLTNQVPHYAGSPLDDAAQVISVDIRGGWIPHASQDPNVLPSSEHHSSTSSHPPSASKNYSSVTSTKTAGSSENKASSAISAVRRTSVSSVRSSARGRKHESAKVDSPRYKKSVVQVPGSAPSTRPATPVTAVENVRPSPVASQVFAGPGGDADHGRHTIKIGWSSSSETSGDALMAASLDDRPSEIVGSSQTAKKSSPRAEQTYEVSMSGTQDLEGVEKTPLNKTHDFVEPDSQNETKESVRQDFIGVKPHVEDQSFAGHAAEMNLRQKSGPPMPTDLDTSASTPVKKTYGMATSSKNKAEEPKKQFTKVFDITSVQAPEIILTRSSPEPLPEKSEDLVKATKKELEDLFGILPTPPKHNRKGKERRKDGQIRRSSTGSNSSKPPEKTPEEKELDNIEKELQQMLAPSNLTSNDAADGGLSLEELELEQQLLKEKLAVAEQKVKSSGKPKDKKDGKKAVGKKEKKEKPKDTAREEDLAREREALREKRKQEKQRRLAEALKMQEQIKIKEAERLKKEAEAAARKQQLEAELMEIAREAEEIRQAEEEARAALAEARKTAREEREARRKAEIERKKQEANQRREKERLMQEAARKKERNMLDGIADASQRSKMDEKERLLQEEDEWYREQERMQEDEELARLAREEEDKYAEFEREAEEEAMAHLVDEREAAEQRRRRLQREAKQLDAEQERNREAALAEQQAMEEELRKEEERQARRHEEERLRLIQLQRLEEEARQQMSAEMQARREAALQRREVNLDRRNHLDGVRRSQGMTRPWVFSYYVTWPRQSYERLMGDDSKKKGFQPKRKPAQKTK